eukprot:Platyproteum_vivax@DN9324_c0_g1_i1.p1
MLNHSTSLDVWPILIFCTVAINCLLSSASFHLFGVYSREWFRRLVRLDYTGITLLITGSFTPLLYYGFYCSKWYVILHHVLPSIFASIILLAIMNRRFFSFLKPEYAFARVSVFIGFGLSGFLPIVHMVIYNWNTQFAIWRIVGWMALTGGSYITGGMLYACRFPEKYFPGTFDIWGSSHQIFHLFVLMGAANHYIAVMIAYKSRSVCGCPL